MAAILPLISFFFIFLIFYRRPVCSAGRQAANNKNPCWRDSLLSASVIWAAVLTIITETLNINNLLTYKWIAIAWLLVAAVSAILYFGVRKPRIIQSLRFRFKDISLSLFFLFFVISFYVVIIGVIALIAPPNSLDALTYHMSRVSHWIQNMNVEHYPTAILPQLAFPPWAEFAIMHFQILNFGDRFANFIEYLSMIGCAIGVSLITRQLGGKSYAQIFAAFMSVTLPQGIVYASNSNNHYAAAFWVVCFVYFVLSAIKDGTDWIKGIKIGMSLGLAYLTKGTDYIYTIGFLIWFLFSYAKQHNGKYPKHILLIVLIVITLNAGNYMRNFCFYFRDFHHDYFPTESRGRCSPSVHLNKDFSPQALLFNMAREISLYTSKSPFPPVNEATVKAMRFLDAVFGNLLKSRTTKFHSFSFYDKEEYKRNKAAGNFFHLILISIACLIFIFEKLDSRKILSTYLFYTIFAFMLFCLLVRWGQFNDRYHLPIFVLFCPFAAVVLCGVFGYKINNMISVVLIISSLPYLFYNQNRALIGTENIFNTPRNKQYFKDGYKDAIDYIKSKRYLNIGLILNQTGHEYPFFVFMREGNNRPFRIEHVNVNNISTTLSEANALGGFTPDVIISNKHKSADRISVNSTIYKKEFSSGILNIFAKK